jgi:hypothetical protein
VVSNQVDDADVVPFFVVLTWLGGVGAWAMHEPFGGRRRSVARGIGLVWLLAAAWAAALLLAFAGSSSPPPGPGTTFLGIPTTAYHLLGLYGGTALVVAGALGSDRWFARSSRSRGRAG